ncbi:hypothetical protein QO004_002739 [Rhizobium mesoamericanum]|nr:hypothetical protein [Rhizobium mesoamericanum]
MVEGSEAVKLAETDQPGVRIGVMSLVAMTFILRRSVYGGER